LRLKRLSTAHFRNLRDETISFSPGVNLLVGGNGEGKTNVLEALSIFKIGRSFRTSRDTDLIAFSEPFCRVEVAVEKRGAGAGSFALSIARNGDKRVEMDDKEIDKLSELVGTYPCVLFGPQDLEIVSGPPEERRRFLDVTGSVTGREYFEALRRYRRVLGQRNALLKAAAVPADRAVWDSELVRAGCSMIERRLGLIDGLSRHLRRHLEALGVCAQVDLVYESDVSGELPEGVSREDLFAAELAGVEDEEARRRTTLVGPHRDDLRILFDGRDLRRFGSQGQRRLVAVLLRLTELSYAEEKLGEPCVMLLDDLFSELDPAVSSRLRALLENDHQIFVTSPVALDWGSGEAAYDNGAPRAPVAVFHVEKGKVGQ
jgi:DNA replication and repair protein RecF